MQKIATEILISAYKVSNEQNIDIYEFVLDKNMQVLECIKIESLNKGIFRPIRNMDKEINGLLFELNHVRVNPKLDNSHIIECLTKALNEIGVGIHHKPAQNSMAICYKPLGEINESVRFYRQQNGKLTFLSPTIRPKLISVKKSP